jgi:hypothetical protein
MQYNIKTSKINKSQGKGQRSEMIKKIMMKDLESFRDCALFGRLYKSDFLEKNINKSRLLELVKSKYLALEYITNEDGIRRPSYVLTASSSALVLDRYNMTPYTSNKAASRHDLALKNVLKKIESEQFFSANDIRKMFPSDLAAMGGCPDAGYVNSKGEVVFIEIITKNYKRAEILQKRDFAQSVGCRLQEYRI